MPIDYTETLQMMEAVERATPPAAFLLDTFFPRMPATATTSKISVQFRKAARRLAPFIVRGAKGIDMKRDPIQEETYAPPMMARAVYSIRILSRSAGLVKVSTPPRLRRNAPPICRRRILPTCRRTSSTARTKWLPTS